MKVNFAAGLALALCSAVWTLGADGSWTGYISDSLCGAKGANEKHADCATKYNIDAQDKVAEHAGHHVTVKGSVDGDDLKLTSLEMAK